MEQVKIKEVINSPHYYQVINQITPLNKSQQIESSCNEISFLNVSTVTVFIEGRPLNPGDAEWTPAPARHPLEFDTTIYNIKVDNTPVGGGSTVDDLTYVIVRRKFVTVKK